MEHSAWDVQGTYSVGEPAGLTESARLFGFWRQPEATMRDIVARPSFIVPLVLMCVAVMAYALVAMPPGFRQSSGVPLALAGTAAGVVIRLLIATGLLFAIVGVLAEAPVDFRQLFAVTCYSRVPGVLFTVLAIFLILLRRASGLEDGHPLNPNITNVAYFLNPYACSRFVYSLASSVDVVVFWEFSLVAVGLQATSRVSARNARVSVIGLWLIYAFLLAAWMQWMVR